MRVAITHTDNKQQLKYIQSYKLKYVNILLYLRLKRIIYS